MNALRIAWIAGRELLHERVFYLLLGFAVLCVILSLLLGQLTYAEQAKLTLDLLLGAMHISMVLFAVFMGISLFQREITMGSVAMLLSKPVSRSSFLLGKFIGQVAIESLVLFSMGTATAIMAMQFREIPALAIFQTTFLMSLEISVLTAVAYLFAVNAGAITSSIATGCLFCLGHLRESVNHYMTISKQTNPLWTVLKNLIPNLEVFNTKSLASYGMMLSARELGWAALYGVVCTLFFLAIANLTFGRKDILT